MADASTLARFRAYLLSFLEGFWNVVPVYIFLDKIVFALCLLIIGGVWATDSMKLDVQYKIGITVIVLGAAFMAGHAIYKHNESKKVSPATASPTNSPQERTKNAPELVGRIEVINIALEDGQAPNTSLALVVSIRNAGTPSIVEDWRLVLEVPGKVPITRPPMHVSGTLTLRGEEHHPITYTNKDMLYEKVAMTPIPTGGEARGLLAFFFLGVERSEVSNPETVLKLSFSDVTGRKYEVIQPVLSVTGEPQYFPGLPKVEPKPQQRTKPSKNRE